MVVERVGDRQSNLHLRLDTTPKTSPEKLNQLEAVFLQTMFKSNCIDEHFTHESSSLITPCQSELPLALNRDITPTEKCTDEPISEIKQIKLNQSKDDFIKSIWPFASAASQQLGLKPEILLAQIALETGWGQFVAKDTDGSSSNNLFNIKSKQSDSSVNIKTTEFLNNSSVKMMASFKKYSSVADCFKDYISLMSGERYKVALANANDPERYVNALHQAGYATDPDYSNKVLAIYHGDELKHAISNSSIS